MERLGIVEELQARRALYGRFAYKAPAIHEPPPASAKPAAHPKPVYRPYVPPPSFKRMVAIVCEEWGVSAYELLSPKAGRVRLCPARFAAERLAVHRLGMSRNATGRAMTRDHTSVMYGLKRARELYAHHVEWRRKYDAALAKLEGR